MAQRRWQVPVAVAAAAASATATTTLEAERYRDLAARMPVNADTLFALVAGAQELSEGGPISAWAESVYQRAAELEDARIALSLTAAGFDPNGCTPDAYGILDPDYDGERICAVIRASASGFERWGADGWADSLAPDGMPYVDLHGDVLADALDVTASGMSLVLRPTNPRAFLASKSLGAIVAAVDLTKDDVPADAPLAADAPADEAAPAAHAAPSSVFAVTDPLDTSAVITLFRVTPGPVVAVRKGGAWVPDDGTLLGQLRSIDPPPVVTVPAEQTADVVRQVDDFDATHPQTAKAPAGGGAKNAMVAAAETGEPSVAGLCVRAKDTGRVFMLQRGLDPDDPPAVRGTWEFPGGHREGDEGLHETAQREWEEEVGHLVPGGPVSPGAATWTSPNGVYRGFVHEVPDESGIDIKERGAKINPDDPDGDVVEAVAWWDPAILKGNPAVRPELEKNVNLVHSALDPTVAPIAASAESEHARRVREAKDADSLFDADRAAEDLAESHRRRRFEETIRHRHPTMVDEGIDSSEAATAVAREIRAEDDRRELWEKDRADTLEVERERRLRVQPDVRRSAALAAKEVQHAAGAEPLVADAVPHTAMPPQLVKYWTAGAGAAKIRWNIRGDFKRCRRQLAKYLKPGQLAGACNELHKLATGRWTGSHANKIAEG